MTFMPYPGFNPDGNLRADTPDVRKNVRRSISAPIVADSLTSALSLSSELYNGQEVITKGYDSIGDGGGNHYIYRATGWGAGGYTNDSGFYIQIGSSDAYLEAIDKTIANVRKFKAFGDNIANDTNSIQKAINAVAPSAVGIKTVYFPAGNYIVDNLILPPGTKLVGDGSTNTILRCSNNSSGIFIQDNGNAVRIVIEGISIYGNNNPNVIAGVSLGHNIQWGTGAYMFDVFVRDLPSGIGMDIDQNISSIQECIINDCASGILIRGNGFHANRLTINGCTKNSMDITGAARIFDLEIEAPQSNTVCYTSGNVVIYSAHFSLDNSTPINHTQLFQWNKAEGSVNGILIENGVSSYDNFLTGVKTIVSPQDFSFVNNLFTSSSHEKLILKSNTTGQEINSGEMMLSFNEDDSQLIANINGSGLSAKLPLLSWYGLFDGNDDRCTLTDSTGPVNTTNYTWAWDCSVDAHNVIMAGHTSDSSYLAYFDTQTSLIHKCYGAGSNFVKFTGLANVTSGDHTYILRRNGNGNNFQLWQDGVEMTATYTGTLPNNPSWINLIGSRGGGILPFGGKLRLLRAWDESLSDTEINNYFSGIVPDNFVLDLQFADGAGNFVSDFSSSNNHGILTGINKNFWYSLSDGILNLNEKFSDLNNPPEGKSYIWQSNGSGTGNDGDLILKVTAGGTTKTAKLFDFVNGTIGLSGSTAFKDTTSAMIADSSFTNNQAVITKGYSTIADNGGNLFVYKATGRGSVTIDSGFYFSGPGADDYFEALDKTVANIKSFGAVGNGVADDTVAIQSVLNSPAKIKRIPAGTYRVTSQLTSNQEGISIVGDSQKDSIIQFDINNTTLDGLTLVNTSGSYALNNRIENVTFQEASLRADVRDVLNIEDPSRLLIKNCTIIGGARYGIYTEFTIATSLENVRIQSNGINCLYVPDSPSSTSLFCDKCYFTGAISGSNVDINVVGAVFDNCIFESCLSGYSVKVRGGYSSISNSYFENNNLGDIIVGTGSGGAIAFITNLHSINGAYTDANATHIYVDQYCDQLSIFGSKISVMPNSIKIHPSGGFVFGVGNDWGPHEPEMTDASDIQSKANVALLGVDSATNGTQWFGRVEGRFNNLYFNRSRAPDGLASAPSYSFDDDLDTGIFRIGDNRLGIALGGLTYGDINSTRARFATDKLVAKTFGLEEQSADPSNPTEGQCTIWQSNGAATGNDGDLLAKITASGITKIRKLNQPQSVFSTLSEAVSSDVLVNGDEIRTNGYTSAGDGGGNTYIYRSTGRSSIIIDSGFYITGPGADDYFEALDKSVAKPEQFGAKGDGVTDDTLFFQKAINSGTKKILLNKNYLVSSTISGFIQDQIFEGGGSLIEQSGTILQPMLDINAHNTVVKNINFFGSETIDDWNNSAPFDDSDTHLAAIRIDGSGVLIDGVHIRGKRCGIDVNNSYSRIVNSYLYGLFESLPASGGSNYHQLISLRGERHIIANNQFHKAGASVTCGDTVLNSIITNNYIRDTYDNGIYLSSANGVIVSNNIVEESLGTGIKSRGSFNVLTGNVLKNVGHGFEITATASQYNSLFVNSVLQFASGSSEIFAGNVVTGDSSSATGTVKRVIRTGGAWSAGTAAGYIYVYDPSGTFASGESLNSSGAYYVGRPLIGGEGTIINGNSISNVGGYGIRVNTIEGLAMYGCNITNNYLSNTASGSAPGTEYSNIIVAGFDINIANNNIQAYNNDGLGGITFLNSINCKADGNNINGNVGFYVSNSPDTLITNNTCFAERCMYLVGSNNVTVDTNEFTGLFYTEQLDFSFKNNKITGLIRVFPASDNQELSNYLEFKNNVMKYRGSVVLDIRPRNSYIQYIDISDNHIHAQGGSSSNYSLLFTPGGTADDIRIKEFKLNNNFMLSERSSFATVRIVNIKPEKMIFQGGHYEHLNENALILNASGGNLIMDGVRFFHSKHNTAERTITIDRAYDDGFRSIKFNNCIFGHETLSSDSNYINCNGSVFINSCILNNLKADGGFTFQSGVHNIYYGWDNISKGTTGTLSVGYASGQLFIDTPRYENIQNTLAYSATPTFNFAVSGYNKFMELTGNISSMTVSASSPGDYNLVLKQDNTGGRTVVWPSNILGGPPQPISTSGVSSVYRFYYDGTNFHY